MDCERANNRLYLSRYNLKVGRYTLSHLRFLLLFFLSFLFFQVRCAEKYKKERKEKNHFIYGRTVGRRLLASAGGPRLCLCRLFFSLTPIINPNWERWHGRRRRRDIRQRRRCCGSLLSRQCSDDYLRPCLTYSPYGNKMTHLARPIFFFFFFLHGAASAIRREEKVPPKQQSR